MVVMVSLSLVMELCTSFNTDWVGSGPNHHDPDSWWGIRE